MSDNTETAADAVEALQFLGCREYEAKCYVALSRLSTGTAKDVSEITDIPRTRVYDAMDNLVEKGLVEVQYSTPKRYRSVPVDNAVEWFRNRYESELDRLEESAQLLSHVEPTSIGAHSAVWSLSGLESILIRSNNLIQSAEREVLVYLNERDRFNREILDLLATADPPSVYVAVPTDDLDSFVTESVESASIRRVAVPFTSIRDTDRSPQSLTLIVKDGESLVLRTAPTVSTPATDQDDRAVVAEGRYNAVVTWICQLFDL